MIMASNYLVLMEWNYLILLKKIENLIDAKITNHLSEPKKLGRVKRLEDGNDRYIKILKK